MTRPRGYVVSEQQRLLAAELARRSLLLAALQASLRKSPSGRLRFQVVRLHLKLHHSASWAAVRDGDIRRACRDLRISCTRVFLVGVELRQPRWRRCQVDWRARLEAEGLCEEPPALRRDLLDVDPADGNFPQPGMLITGGDGVHRVVPDPDTIADLADYHDPRSGKREARPRRWDRYLAQLRAYLAKARLPPRDRKILEMTAAGRSSRQIGQALRVHHSGIRARIARHNELAGIDGPGPGR